MANNQKPLTPVGNWLERRGAILEEFRRTRNSLPEFDVRTERGSVAGAGGAGLGGGKGALKPISFGSKFGVERIGSSSRTMAQRYVGMAKGGQSAVVKLTSYGGSARLGSMVNYISREGKLAVENEWGERLKGSAELSAVRGDWDHLMSERADSRDIGIIKSEIDFAGKMPSPDDLHGEVRRALSAAYGGRKFAYGLLEGEGERVMVDGIVMLRDADGNRLTGDAKANEFVVEAFAKSAVSSEVSASFRFAGHGNGVEFGSSRLRGLVEKFDGAVYDQSGSVIATAGGANALMQRGWREEMHSRKARDVMHVMVSARAGTNVDQFREAAREFLSKQFGGHRYVWAVHDPADDPKDAINGGKRPHVHAHAVITMRSDYGDRVRPTIATFREWRLNMADAARNHGIAMEMTDRRDVAAAPAFTKGQVRPIYDSGRTRHAGTSEAAQARYERKRAETPVYASTEHSRAYAGAARQQWQVMAMAANDRSIVAFAERVESRIIEAQGPDASPKVAGVLERDTIKDMKGSPMREMTRDDLNAYEIRVGAELSRAAARIGPEDKIAFDRTVIAVENLVEARRALVDMQEALAHNFEGRETKSADKSGTGNANSEREYERDDASERAQDNKKHSAEQAQDQSPAAQKQVQDKQRDPHALNEKLRPDREIGRGRDDFEAE
jgi:hypothetical protein